MHAEPAIAGDFIHADDMSTGTSIAAYRQTDAALSILRERYAGKTYDLTTTEGMADAKAARKELRGYRTGLEKARVAEKADALKHCNLVDAEAKRIREAIEALESPIEEAIKAEEARAEQARIEAERAEAARLAAQAERMVAFRTLPLEFIGRTAADIEARLAQFGNHDLEGFDECNLADALTARDDAMRQLRGMLETAKAGEKAAAVLAEREAELAQQRAEQERKLAEQRAEDERKAEEARAEQEAAAAVERERMEAERAELARMREEQAERERAAEAEQRRADEARAFIRTLREHPLGFVNADSAAISAEIDALTTREWPSILNDDECYTAMDARAAAVAKLREMFNAARGREAEAEERRRQGEERAREEREREQVEASRKQQEEADAIARASLFDAATEAVAYLDSIGHGDSLPARKLAAAIARHDQ